MAYNGRPASPREPHSHFALFALASRLFPMSTDPVQSETLLPPPLLSRLERMELVSRKVFRGRLKGERRSRRKGQSVEFADFRNYTPGDDLRFVDWNLYARLDKLFLKLFMEEEDLHVYLLVDASPSMDFGQPTKFFCAQRIAAGLAFVGMCRGDRVKVEFLGANHQPCPVLRSKSQLHRMLDFVQSAEPKHVSPLVDSIKLFCMRNNHRGVVILISDLMDKSGYESALRLLIGQQMDVFLLHLLSPEEIQPSLTGDLKLVDCEDSDETEISMSSALLKQYQRTLADFLEQARKFCAQRDINYLFTRSDHAADMLVGQYLIQRGLIR
jgi:uncharacterized protein (DUF58 family)